LNRIRWATAEKADYLPLGPFAIAGIYRHHLARRVSYHTLVKILAIEPMPLHRRTEKTNLAAATVIAC